MPQRSRLSTSNEIQKLKSSSYSGIIKKIAPASFLRLFSWRIFMTKLEPTFSGMFEPRRLASASTRFAPPEKPFALFLQFPPPRFLRS